MNSDDYDPNVDYYAILEVAENANAKEIRQSYFKLCLKVHPDKNPNATEIVQKANVEKMKVEQKLSEINKELSSQKNIIKDKESTITEKLEEIARLTAEIENLKT